MNVALRSKVPGSVTCDIRAVAGRDVAWVEVDAAERRGALTSDSSSTLEAAAATARANGIPLVCVMRSSGADIVEGFAALHGWGRAAKALADCSGIVPTVFVVDGPAVSGPALLLGLADHVVMTREAYAFVSGPTMVAEFTGVMMDNQELGGAASHARYTGAATLIADDIESALALVEQLLSYFPSNNSQEPPMWATDDPHDRATEEAGELLPATSTG
ncbi:MAG: carboxyl transferase domain-containing protein, partial [Ilumatobacteraceae bacterium]